MTVEEREIDRSELYMADEVFFCGTGVQMAAVSTIDHRLIGNGEKGAITQQIGDLFYQILIGEDPEYTHWITPVYV